MVAERGPLVAEDGGSELSRAGGEDASAPWFRVDLPMVPRATAPPEPPQGRKAARIRLLCRVCGGPLVSSYRKTAPIHSGAATLLFTYC